MNPRFERNLIRTLHLVLSVPVVGYIYGPVANIPEGAAFTRYVAFPAVVLSGIWLWQKPRILRLIQKQRNLTEHPYQAPAHKN
jgi:hypothetical protein